MAGTAPVSNLTPRNHSASHTQPGCFQEETAGDKVESKLVEVEENLILQRFRGSTWQIKGFGSRSKRVQLAE